MTLQECLEQMPDPGRAEGRRYELIPLLMGTILAIAGGATSYRQVHRFLAAHGCRVIAVFGGSWKRAPAYTTGATSCSSSSPPHWKPPFAPPARALLVAQGEVPGRCIAIDGKVLCGRFDHVADPRAAQRLGALAHAEHLILAHVPMADKSNEIPVAQPLIAE